MQIAEEADASIGRNMQQPTALQLPDRPHRVAIGNLPLQQCIEHLHEHTKF